MSDTQIQDRLVADQTQKLWGHISWLEENLKRIEARLEKLIYDLAVRK